MQRKFSTSLRPADCCGHRNLPTGLWDDALNGECEDKAHTLPPAQLAKPVSRQNILSPADIDVAYVHAIAWKSAA